jgi:hypothetical protein
VRSDLKSVNAERSIGKVKEEKRGKSVMMKIEEICQVTVEMEKGSIDITATSLLLKLYCIGDRGLFGIYIN